LLPPNNGLLPPNDSLLPPNDGLPAANDERCNGIQKKPMRIGLKIGIKQQIYKLLSLLIKHLYRQRTAGQLYFSPEGLKVAHKICT
jgi:hypothetical protein